MRDARIVVYGTVWCGDCWRTKRFLDRRGLEYDWVDVEQDQAALDLIQRIQSGGRSVPVVVLPDGRHLVEPSEPQLADALGLSVP